jgi:uncharacterized protein DUF5681
MDPISRAQSAENSVETARKAPHLTQYRWPKGISGNPNGRPPKAQRVTRIYNRILRKRKNQKEIEASLMDTLTSRGMAKVLLLREMAERTEGKVVQDENINVNLVVSLAEKVSQRRKQLTDAND